MLNFILNLSIFGDFFINYNLITMQLVLLSGVIILSFIKTQKRLNDYALAVSTLVFAQSIYLFIIFNTSIPDWQLYNFIPLPKLFGSQLMYAVDGISILFILLTTFITPICILSARNIINNQKGLLIAILLIETSLIGVFCSTDLIIFFIFFEAVVLPMMFVIGVWGSRGRKIKANFYFILYTLFGSIFMLFAILIIYCDTGTTNILFLTKTNISFEKQLLVWICFFIGFAVKIPIIPFHIWLPEAHVEAPTVGSVILASLLLKLGGYGLLRISLPVCPVATIFFVPFANVIAIVSVIYASFMALIQIDMKRIIAYSSIAHMNLAVLGIFALNVQGLQGAILLMIGHGLVSGALFFIIGMLYDRHHTKIIKYYGGFARIMPLFCIFFLFLSFANLSLPGTSNFIGELLIFIGVFEKNPFLVLFGLFSSILTTIYSIWLFNRIAFGELKIIFVTRFYDLTPRELLVLAPLAVGIVFIGLYPNPLLNCIHASVKYLTILILA